MIELENYAEYGDSNRGCSISNQISTFSINFDWKFVLIVEYSLSSIMSITAFTKSKGEHTSEKSLNDSIGILKRKHLSCCEYILSDKLRTDYVNEWDGRRR